MTSKRRHHGFSLMEMLIVLGVLGIAMVVEGRMYHDFMLAIRSSSAAENQINSLSHMSYRLRKDVWGAQTIDTPDRQTIVLGYGDGAMIRWKLSDTDITRSAGPADAQQQWSTSIPMYARRDRAVVVLSAGSGHQTGGSEMRFLSQVMLARGGHE